MDQGASRTATVVTLWRAIESSRSASTRLFEDPLAFLPWRFRWTLRLSRLLVVGDAVPWSLIDGHWASPRGTVAVRTRYVASVRQVGEPYTFGFDPAELADYAEARGLRLVEDIGATEFRARYLAPRGRDREPLTEFQRAARVEVVGRG